MPNEGVIADTDLSRCAGGRNGTESLNSPVPFADFGAPLGDDSGVVRVILIWAYCPYTDSATKQQEFFTANGELLLHPIARRRSTSNPLKWVRRWPSPSTLGWTSRNFSLTSLGSSLSTDTFVTHGSNHTLNLTELCDTINRHRSLQNASIVSAEGYCRSIGHTGIVHRFIILELERDGRQRIWLRIDRRRGRESPMRFITRVATSPANDQVNS